MRLFLLGYVALATPFSVVAQPFTSPAGPTPALPGSVGPLVVAVAAQPVLRTGTEVPLRLLEMLSTEGKALRGGYRFRLETVEPVAVQGVTIIPVGTSAVGEITDVTNKGMWGKSGRLNARLLYLNVNGRQIRLSGEFNDKGVAGGAAAVAVSAIVFLPAGFFMTGTSAKLPPGTIVKGFIDEDVPLVLAGAAPPPPAPPGLATPAAGAMMIAAPGSPAPAVALPAGGIAKRPAKTPSGYCYDVPRNYVGLGSLDLPAITSATPACRDVPG